ncbi:MAG: hypothetical protein OEX07_13020 [Gammaproteobacteria bacterium]|nr:hypothetical protein [Gammaproteobacteria bacterium]
MAFGFIKLKRSHPTKKQSDDEAEHADQINYDPASALVTITSTN